jgi:hypothetical protein
MKMTGRVRDDRSVAAQLTVGISLFFLGLNANSILAQSLGLALDNTNLTWTTSGTGSAFGWSASGNSPHTGPSDASSGSLGTAGSTSTLQTTVNGPGTLTFWWKTTSSSCLLSLVDGKQTLTTYSGDYTSWQSSTYYIGAGSQTLKWVYSVGSPPSDYRPAYVDGVSYTPGATLPYLVEEPLGQSQVQGLNAMFTVNAAGSPPLDFQWQFEGQPLIGATTSSLALTNVDGTKIGNYSVVVTNAYGSIASSNARLELGQVTAWGLSGYNATTVPPGATNVLAITAGSYFGLLLRNDGSLLGWGNPSAGGNPPALSDVIGISGGNDQGLALYSNRTVTVWGDNTYGATNVPAGLTNVAGLGKSFSTSLALTADGEAVAWGHSVGDETNVPPDLTNAVELAGGGFLNLALKRDGTVACWGGEVSAPPLSNIVAVAAGAAHYLALGADGTVIAWGQNDQGQASVPMGLSNVVAIAAGSFHSLALRADGTVVAWGSANGGVTNVPAGLTNVIAIAAGDYQSLALVGTGRPILHASLISPSWSAGGFTVYVSSESGRVYQLQYKASAQDASWVSLPLAPGTGKTLTLLDPGAGAPGRIYRVLRW